MPIKVEITDDKLTYFSDEAKNELQKHMEKHAIEVIDETNRLEASMREDSYTPEITRVLVNKAINKYKNQFNVGKKTKFSIIIKLISTITILLTGLIFDFNAIKTSTVHLIIFIIFLTIAIISTTVMYTSKED